MKKLILILLGALFLAACNKNKPPKGIMDNEKMISVLTDIHLADAYVNMLPQSDSLKPQSDYYRRAVFAKYKISRNDLNRSLNWYSKQPKALDSIYSQVLKRLEIKEKQQARALKKKAI